MLSGYCRLTYSLTVIMLETTSSINIFLPMMIGILCSRATANLFCGSLYDRALRAKQMPFLRATPPEKTKYYKASQIMVSEVISLPSIANMEAVRKALESHHQAFPVVNTADRLVGLIPKSSIITILEHKAFYDMERIDRNSIQDSTNPPASFSLNDNGEQPLLKGDSSGTADQYALDYDERHGFPATRDILPW